MSDIRAEARRLAEEARKTTTTTADTEKEKQITETFDSALKKFGAADMELDVIADQLKAARDEKDLVKLEVLQSRLDLVLDILQESMTASPSPTNNDTTAPQSRRSVRESETRQKGVVSRWAHRTFVEPLKVPPSDNTSNNH